MPSCRFITTAASMLPCSRVKRKGEASSPSVHHPWRTCGIPLLHLSFWQREGRGTPAPRRRLVDRLGFLGGGPLMVAAALGQRIKVPRSLPSRRQHQGVKGVDSCRPFWAVRLCGGCQRGGIDDFLRHLCSPVMSLSRRCNLNYRRVMVCRCPPSWEPQEEGMMSTAASLPSV
jgi:hypothetical protein